MYMKRSTDPVSDSMARLKPPTKTSWMGDADCRSWPTAKRTVLMSCGKGSKLAEFTPDELMHSGNGELINWVITAGICGDVKCQVLDYIRLWHIGLGYLYWEV